MNRLAMILGIVLLAGAVAVPAMALGPGMGWGHHRMGYGGNGPGYGTIYGNLTPDQRSSLRALDSKFYGDTQDLRQQIWTKSDQLDAVLNSANPDAAKAKALQKEISDLQANLDQKRLNYELEAHKIVPNQYLAYSYGPWYGHHMGRFGYRMGYDSCWY